MSGTPGQGGGRSPALLKRQNPIECKPLFGEKCEKSRNPKSPKNETSSLTYYLLRISDRKPVSRGPPIELHLLECSGPILETFVFFRLSSDQAKTRKEYAETATCYRSLEENSPWDHAQIRERPTWRSIARSRALYDQMAPQLCLFYISAKFNFPPTRQHNIGNTVARK